MPESRLCLSLTGKTLRSNLDCISKYRKKIDMVELRADFLKPSELGSIQRFPGKCDLPVIFTVRLHRDGGYFSGKEKDRRKLLSEAAGSGYSYIDIEEDLVDRELEHHIRKNGARIIRSIHDFSGVPGNLAGRIRNLSHNPTDIPKAAVMPQNTLELLRLIEIFQDLETSQKILIGMGELGLLTRVLAPKLGSWLSYCSSPEKEAAPGHLDPDQLIDLYRFKSIDASTQIFGVIGNPIRHSLSPQIHNYGYKVLGINAVYLPLLVEDLESFFRLADILRIKGLSVTLPLKESVISHLAEQDERLGSIGACNTLVRKASGWYGTNTDVDGFLKPLKTMCLNKELTDRPQAGEFGPGPRLKATVIGAGGAARSVVYALNQCGIKPLILNRTTERAESLARRFGCPYSGIDAQGYALIEEYSDLIVQSTSVGMEPQAGGDPLPDYRFKGTELVYDLVYKPHLTRFLQRAQDAGCRIIPGLEMLKSQAEAQFKLFTGREYPIYSVSRYNN